MRVLIKFKDNDIQTADCCEVSCIGSILTIYEPVPGSDDVMRSTSIDLSKILSFQIVDDFNF